MDPENPNAGTPNAENVPPPESDGEPTAPAGDSPPPLPEGWRDHPDFKKIIAGKGKAEDKWKERFNELQAQNAAASTAAEQKTLEEARDYNSLKDKWAEKEALYERRLAEKDLRVVLSLAGVKKERDINSLTGEYLSVEKADRKPVDKWIDDLKVKEPDIFGQQAASSDPKATPPVSGGGTSSRSFQTQTDYEKAVMEAKSASERLALEKQRYDQIRSGSA